MAANKHPKEGKTCRCCGHLIYWLKGRGYRCMCDKAVVDDSMDKYFKKR